MELDRAIQEAFEDFALSVEDIILHVKPATAFCRTVIRRHGAPLSNEVILERLLDLDQRGELPLIVSL